MTNESTQKTPSTITLYCASFISDTITPIKVSQVSPKTYWTKDHRRKSRFSSIYAYEESYEEAHRALLHNIDNKLSSLEQQRAHLLKRKSHILKLKSSSLT